ncbi:uncharacterized protein LOC143041799 [Oratosquilla oratoria]|uniref:uncharacterized protein LOC143041799 n=1 Tax=Oratosquilla oratoria TaxID=337810 RepID=UPI003F766258
MAAKTRSVRILSNMTKTSILVDNIPPKTGGGDIEVAKERRDLKKTEAKRRNVNVTSVVHVSIETASSSSIAVPKQLGDFKCKYCQALMWKKEPRTFCCNNGQVAAVIPSEIKDKTVKSLYDGTSEFSDRFLGDLVGFNNLFCFTSFSTPRKLENALEKSICFKVQGRIYHRLREAVEVEKKDFWKNKGDSFLDLYFYHDRDQQIKLRIDKIKDLKSEGKIATKKRRSREEKEYEENEKIIKMLFEYFAENNSCLSSMLKEVENSKELVRFHIEKHGKIPEMTLILKAAEGLQTREHKGVYHLPSSSAAVGGIVNLEPGNDPPLVIITSPKPGSNYVTRILEHSNFFYDPFQYPLLIPHGNMGYSYTLKLLQKGDKVRKYNKLTPAAFYSSMYMEREGVFNYITKCRRLFQQFVVDNYVKVETMRLDFIERNQNEIRKERSDILRGENGKDRGQRIIIPPSYVGGPRYIKQRQQDALAFVTNYGSPDFFITFTMNPAWEELEEATSQTGGNAASGSYVTKYVNKGCDRILYTKTEKDKEIVNEVRNYQDARFVNANEATWKIFKYPIHKSFPPVTTLDLHLEGENEVFFNADHDEETLLRNTLKDTQLTSFFKLCQKNEFTASLLYHEIPNFFIYDKLAAKWIERKTKTAALGRVRAVTTKTVELFYLRMLLSHKRGPTSYKDLRRVEGVEYETYREAVKAMGLLNDEEMWKKTIMEILYSEGLPVNEMPKTLVIGINAQRFHPYGLYHIEDDFTCKSSGVILNFGSVGKQSPNEPKCLVEPLRTLKSCWITSGEGIFEDVQGYINADNHSQGETLPHICDPGEYRKDSGCTVSVKRGWM